MEAVVLDLDLRLSRARRFLSQRLQEVAEFRVLWAAFPHEKIAAGYLIAAKLE